MANTEITKHAIQNAFWKLLNEKPLDKITVKEISERCGINRNTFYYHYQDSLALLEEICARDFDALVVKYPALNSLDECLDAIMHFAQQNKKVIMHIYNSERHDTYIQTLRRMCEHVVTTYMSTALPDVELSDYDKQLFKTYLKGMLFGLVVEWINTGMQDEYIEGMHRIYQNSQGVVELVIDNCMASYEH